MLPTMSPWPEEVVGGLAGGEAKRVAWGRGRKRCDGSHESADGISILSACCACVYVSVVVESRFGMRVSQGAIVETKGSRTAPLIAR